MIRLGMLINGNSVNRIDGTPDNFKIKLRLNDDHNKKYNISLSQAIIPFCWPGILRDDYFIMKHGNISHKIDYGYDDGNYYINDIVLHLKSRLNLYSVGFSWTVLYNKHNNKLQFIPSIIPTGGLSFDFTGAETNLGRSLNRYMGFEKKIYNIFEGGIVSVIPLEINDQFISILLSASTQLSKNLNSDETGMHISRIFTRIPLIGSFGSAIVWQNVNNQNSNIIVQGLDNIHFELQNSRGFSLNLKNNWNFTLHIEEIKDETQKFMKLLKEISGYLSNIDEIGVLSLIQKDNKNKLKKDELLEEINEIEKLE